MGWWGAADGDFSLKNEALAGVSDSTIQDLFHVATNCEFRIQTINAVMHRWLLTQHSAVCTEKSKGRKEGEGV